MGIYDREYYQHERREYFQNASRTMVTNLVILNVVIYVVDVLSRSQDFALGEWLVVKPIHLRQPWMWWRFITYGFAHDHTSVMHIIGNMLGLYMFGNEIEQIYGPKLFLRMYLTCLALCSSLWAVAQLAAQRDLPLLGASGAVTAVVLLFSLNFPRRMVLLYFIPVPAWVLGIVVVASDLAGMNARNPDHIAYEVHLLGAAYGYLFYRTRWAVGSPWTWPRTGRGWGRWFSGKPALRIHHPEPVGRSLEAEADAILDKLHREGEASLTARERKVLEEYSRKMKQKYR